MGAFLFIVMKLGYEFQRPQAFNAIPPLLEQNKPVDCNKSIYGLFHVPTPNSESEPAPTKTTIHWMPIMTQFVDEQHHLS
jgi:hypothetical protein